MLRSDLTDLINKMNIVKNRTNIEAFDYLMFQGSIAVAFNGTVGIFMPFETLEPFSVPLAEFSKVVKACRDDEVDITVAEEQVHIKSGRLKASIVTNIMPEEEFNILIDVQRLKYKPLPEGFIEGLEMCARTSSDSVTMDVLNSVYVNKTEIVGSDDARVTVFTIPKSAGRFILPYSSIKDIARFAPVKIGLTEGWAVFEDGDNNTMAVRTVNDEYPAYNQLFEVETKRVKLPEAVSDLISSASVFSETTTEEEYSEAVFVRMRKDSVQVRSENHMGKIINSVKCKTGLKTDIEIVAHPKMFVEAISLSDGVIGVGTDRIIIESEKVRHVAGLQES